MSALDTPVSEAVWAALDFESAGFAPGQTDEPVQVGIALWNFGDAEPRDFLRSYICPAGSITREAKAVHGIGEKQTAEAPALAALWPEFRRRLTGAVIVAHGAGTEKRFLRGFPLHGFGPWVDTLALSRALHPALSEHSLGEVVRDLGKEQEVQRLCPGLGWHDALFDAVACLVLLRHWLSDKRFSGARVGQLVNLDAAAYHRVRGARRVAGEAGWSGS